MRNFGFAVLLAWSAISLGTRTAQAKMPENGIYVRIIAFDNAFKSEWGAGDHNAQDVLRMIEELKPDVLNRFTTGQPKTDATIPVAPGSRPLDFIQFLNAAQKAGAPGCTLTAKVHLNDVWPDGVRQKVAQDLHNLPVTPRLFALDLDGYFSSGGKEQHKSELQKFKDMGWTDLGFNFGNRKETYNYGSYGMALVNSDNWTIDRARLQILKQEKVDMLLFHIDYPSGIKKFAKLSPDRQADVITKQIAPKQKEWGFRFVYPILYSGYDATKEVTRADGPYKGATLFQIIKQEIDKDRAGRGGGKRK